MQSGFVNRSNLYQETMLYACRQAWLRKDLHVVLVEAKIPQNVGEPPQRPQHYVPFSVQEPFAAPLELQDAEVEVFGDVP